MKCSEDSREDEVTPKRKLERSESDIRKGGGKGAAVETSGVGKQGKYDLQLTGQKCSFLCKGFLYLISFFLSYL